MIAVGVARPSAHGHAMTNTETKMVSTNVMLNSGSTKAQIMAATTAMAITVGTKYPATVSANLEIGAFLPCASSIIFTILAKVVSEPTWVTFTITAP